MDKTLIRAVVFDMDGLLLDTESVYEWAWREAARRLSLKDIDLVHKKVLGMGKDNAMSFLKSVYGNTFDGDLFWNLTSELSLDYVEKDGVPVKEGGAMILPYLKEKGYALFLASSSERYWVTKLLDGAGLLMYFDEVICGDEVKAPKPAPDIYAASCVRLGFAPSQCVAVEDSPNGIQSAYSAGLMCVMVPDRIPCPKNIVPLLWKKLSSLFELAEYL